MTTALTTRSQVRSFTCGAYGLDVQTYQFPADLHLPHGLIDVQEPDQNVAVVYPKLLELIDQ